VRAARGAIAYGVSRVWSTGRTMAALLVVLAALLAAPDAAFALKPIEVNNDQGRVEITPLGDLYESRGDSLQVETAAGADGLAGRMSVAASTPGTNPNWIVFALTNPTDKPVERWLAADRYDVIGSGIVWPDLDGRRIEAVTPSIGFVPERIKSDRADIFRVTLEPGQTITYVVELASDRFVRLNLWKPLDYELKISDRQLFNGVMLGLTGLMAIFLTAIFAANHKLVFPAAALVAWCTLGYLCVDFGFFHKLFQLKPEANAVYRAASESALAASLVVFVHVFLRLALWHGLIRMLISVWLLAQFSLIAVAIIDPRLAATFARLSFLFIGATGAGLILFLAVRNQDRALSLIPTWILFLVWIFGAAVALTGRLSGEVVQFGLVSGLVLILLLIGFTVTQYAFRSVEPLFGATPSELQVRSIAVDASGAAVWEWNARRDEVKVSQAIDALLGLAPGELSTRTDDFLRHLHPSDRERFRLALFTVQERRDSRVCCEFRLRQADNNYRWFEIEAAGVPGSDPRAFKCIGLLRDITDAKRAHERLLYDAVHDSLTGLPNRELLLDRLEVMMKRAKSEPQVQPTVLIIDIDKFTSINSSLGLVLGDSLLLTIARRLQRHTGPNDTLARISGDRFALLLQADQPMAELAQHAERIRRSLRSPIKIAGQEIVLTGSIGIAVYDGKETSHEDLLKKAEIAMFRAKRAGADRIEVFTPDMRADQSDRQALEAELVRAMEKNLLRVSYLPIIYLPTEELAGFQAVVRWDHPQLGSIDPCSFAPFSEDGDIIAKLSTFLLHRAARDVTVWQKEFPRSEQPLFVSVSVSSRHLFRQDVIQEIRHVLGRTVAPKGSIRLEVTEQLALENPEQATEVLEWLRSAGAEIVLDEFGTGYSSLAYLDRLPFDGVKIDQALMQAGSVKGGDDSMLVRSMVALAHELDKKVLAKGVEAPTEMSFLRSIECEYAQGPYCGDPVAEDQVVAMLASVRSNESKIKPAGLYRTKTNARKGRKGAQRPDGPRVPPAAAAANGSGAPPPGAAMASANGAAPNGTGAHRPAAGNSAQARAPQPPRRLNAPRPQRVAGAPPGAPPPADRAPGPPPVRSAQTAPATAAAAPPPVPTAASSLHPLSPSPFMPAPASSHVAPAASGGLPPPLTRVGDVLPDVASEGALRPVAHGSAGRRADGPPVAAAPPPLPVAPPLTPAEAQRPILVQSPPMPPGVSPQMAPMQPMPAAQQRPTTVRPAAPPPQPPPAPKPAAPQPDFSNLPPAIAESLARLAGVARKPG